MNVSIQDIKEAMAWWNALSPNEMLKHRKKIERNDAISIARYWLKEIK
ncbi:hypothetical protein [Burkholderia phage vB_BpP_HN05]